MKGGEDFWGVMEPEKEEKERGRGGRRRRRKRRYIIIKYTRAKTFCLINHNSKEIFNVFFMLFIDQNLFI